MKKIKSVLALTLAAAMSTLLLAGCGPKIQVQQNGAPAGSGSQETQAAADTGAAPSIFACRDFFLERNHRAFYFLAFGKTFYQPAKGAFPAS